MLLENFLAEQMNITSRNDREDHRALNLEREDDRTYIRCKFKRLLRSKRPSEIILTNNNLQRTRINENTFSNGIDYDSIADLNNMLDTISNWINVELSTENLPMKITLE